MTEKILPQGASPQEDGGSTPKLTLEVGSRIYDGPHKKRRSPSERFTQKLRIYDEAGKLEVGHDLYPYAEGGLGSFYWHTDISAEKFVGLVEGCLAYYEGRFRDGRLITISGEEEELVWEDENDPYSRLEITHPENPERDMLIIGKRDGEYVHSRPAFPDRPLTLGKILNEANLNEVSFIRLNTPVGDFIFDTNVFGKGQLGAGVLFTTVDGEGLVEFCLQSSSHPNLDRAMVEDLFSQGVEILQQAAQDLSPEAD